MPRGVPRVQPTPTWENPLDGPQTAVDVTQAGGDQDTDASLPVTPPGPAQPDHPDAPAWPLQEFNDAVWSGEEDER